MNPVLIILIFLGGGILWLLLSLLYRPIGKVFNKLLNDAGDAMFEDKENDKEEKENNEES